MNSSSDCEDDSIDSIKKDIESSLSPHIKRSHNPVLKKIASKSITYTKNDFESRRSDAKIKTNKGCHNDESAQSELEKSNKTLKSNKNCLINQKQNLITKVTFERRKSSVMEQPNGKLPDLQMIFKC